MGHLPFPTEMYPPLVGHNIHRLNSPLNIIDVQYQLHDYYSTMRPQGQNVVQREVVRTVYISVYSIQETSSLIVQRIVDDSKNNIQCTVYFRLLWCPPGVMVYIETEMYFIILHQS